MPINIGQPFKRTSAGPIDMSLTLTKAEMLAVKDSEMPAKYFTICQEDGQVYLYDKSATPSAQTGKFKLLESGGTESMELTQAEYDALSDDEKMNGTIYFITDGQGGGGSGLPAGGTTGQYLVKKSDADGDAEWKDLVLPDGWGVAKSETISVPIANQAGSFTINISDLGITSVNNYNVVFSIVGGTGSGAWGDSTVFAYGRTTSAINGSVNTLQGDIQSVLVSYVVVAKGFQSIMSGVASNKNYTTTEKKVGTFLGKDLYEITLTGISISTPSNELYNQYDLTAEKGILTTWTLTDAEVVATDGHGRRYSGHSAVVTGYRATTNPPIVSYSVAIMGTSERWLIINATGTSLSVKALTLRYVKEAL